MNYRIEYTAVFESELYEAIDWYLEISEKIASKFIAQFNEIQPQILSNPRSFPNIKQSRFRRVLFQSFPYKVIYRVDDDIIYVIALVHTARSNKFIKRRLKIN